MQNCSEHGIDIFRQELYKADMPSVCTPICAISQPASGLLGDRVNNWFRVAMESSI